MRIELIFTIFIVIDALSATGAVNECIDLLAECAVKSHLCDLSDYDGLMNFFCKKTCSRDCSPFTTTTTLKACADITPDCLTKKGLCALTSFNSLTTLAILCENMRLVRVNNCEQLKKDSSSNGC